MKTRSIFKPAAALSLALVAALLVTMLASADFVNGGFEAGDFSSWTSPLNSPITPETIFLNHGLTGPQPFGWNSIVRDTGGTNDSAIVTAGADPIAGIPMVHSGTYAARVNDSINGWHANAIRQTATVQSGDAQPDGSIHLRFAYAPVVEDPGHSAEAQPYFFVGVRNLTTGQTLYEEFAYAGQPGYPWQIAGGWKYMDWQEVDLVSYATNPVISVGDLIELEAIGADCAAGGHGGYVYVDDFGFAVPTGTSPTLTDITPNSGVDTGGTVVTLTGTNLDTVTALDIGTDTILPAAFTTQTATTIVFVTPGDPAGWVNVIVVNPSGSASLFNGFNYIAIPAPTISSIVPNSGPTSGGTTVVITGTDLTGGTVTFDGLPATCTVDSATQITCTSPAHAAGAVDVAVTTGGGTATSVGGFTYVPLPTVTGIVPNSGPTGGGTTVIILGTGFTGSTAFTFGGSAATCTVNSDTQITCASPAHAAGPVDVVVTTPSGTATAVNGFTYIPATLTLTASGPATLKPGDPYVYTFNYTTDVKPFSAQVLFTLPGHTTYVSNTGGYACVPAAGVVTCTLGALTTNGSFTVTVLVDKLKKIDTSLTLAMASYSISDNGAAPATGLAAVTANVLTPFADVPAGYWAIDSIQSIWAYGITTGCGIAPLIYCPTSDITRGEMAVFIERAMHGGSFNPGTPALTFTDTAASAYRYFIEALRSDGVTIGCGGSNYCPLSSITRAEMSVFLLRGRSGPGYLPPAATGLVWTDVPATYWAARFAEELGTAHISSGCTADGKFCPDNATSREEMAIFVQRTFGLTMPTP